MKKKKQIVVGVIVMIVAVIFISFFAKNERDIWITDWEKIDSLSDKSWEYDKSNETLKRFMDEEIAAITYDFNDMNQKMDWFIEYKKIISKYPKELHMPTIYETYSASEIDLLFRIVQCEVGDEYDFDEKANVVSVIFNRCVKNNATITQVLTAKNQFTPYSTGVYKSAKIDEKTILACEYVFMFGDTTNGCMAFKSVDLSCQDTWYNWTKQFLDDAHCFYK